MDVENQENAAVEKHEKWRNFKTPMQHNISIGCGNKWFRLYINPVVTFVSAAIIWGFVIWCTVEPDNVRVYIFDTCHEKVDLLIVQDIVILELPW